MNLREKFLWNILVLISVLAFLWNGWNLFTMQLEANNSFLNYENEEVGTDKILEKKVSELENIYLERDKMKFIMTESPVDLSKVVSVGIGGSKRRKKLWVSGIINKSNGATMAIISYKDNIYNVQKGDSIAGGLITEITNTEVVFEKNEKIHKYNLGLNQSVE